MHSLRRLLLPLGLVAAVAAAAVLAGCGSGSSGSSNKVSLVAYSTPQTAYESIIAALPKTPAGKGVTFQQSYGASGDQSRAVIGGLPADYVAFSLAPGMDQLPGGKLAHQDW